ncbi:MAG: GNAT family N-acetyltransferase [Saprospiraceae bacterium]|nr:GNAT family N-acetyltransferase [Saprospiraceae bacterium]
MFAEKHFPEIVLPSELDAYLSKGWYRMGQTLFTTHFLCFDEEFYSAIWIRLPLRDYRFRKSLRKLLRRNRREFEVRIRPAFINREKELLYQKYRGDFAGILAPSLKQALLDGEDFSIFDTREVAVYHRGRLVAVSFFDLGKDSVASIMGIYDPELGKHSLGFYTMLEEIDYARKKKLAHYYPGYVVPGYARFDYKLRIGPVEYFDIGDGKWNPYDFLKPDEVPISLMNEKLDALAAYLSEKGIPVTKKYYPLFEANLFGFWQAPFFDFPVFLHCFPDRPGHDHLVAVFDPRSKRFNLGHCLPYEDVLFYFNEIHHHRFSREDFFLQLLTVEETLICEDQLHRVGEELQNLYNSTSAGRP